MAQMAQTLQDTVQAAAVVQVVQKTTQQEMAVTVAQVSQSLLVGKGRKMRTAIIETGEVINVILGQIEGSIEIPDDFGIGDLYENGEFKKAPITPVEPEPIKVPTQITPRQIRQQLTAIGLRKTVEDLISASDDYDLKDWWNHSQDFQRSHHILKEMGEKLGLTSEQLDEMFIEASKL